MAQGEGVRLTKSEFREALRAFAERETAQGPKPDLPKYLSNDPIRPTVGEEYLSWASGEQQVAHVQPDGSNPTVFPVAQLLREQDEQHPYLGVLTVTIAWGPDTSIEAFLAPQQFVDRVGVPAEPFYDRVTVASGQTTGNVDVLTVSWALNGQLDPSSELSVVVTGDLGLGVTSSSASVTYIPRPYRLSPPPNPRRTTRWYTAG